MPVDPEPRPIRLLLAEDHSVVAMALESAFEIEADIELVGTAKLIEEAVAAAGRSRPDVILLDRRLPDGDGVDAIGRLHAASPGTRVLVFTGYATQAIVDRVAAAGGAGLVLKAGSLLDDLLDTIRRVAAGQDHFDVDLRQ
ncbi:response regulator [Flindersiella endophytica]